MRQLSIVLVLAACGGSGSGRSESAIDNGSLDTGDPAAVALRYPGFTSSFCSASLVAQSTVLTAGHCVFDKMPGLLTVVFGSNALLPTQAAGVTAITLHPQFTTSPSVTHDIAMLQLALPITNVTPVRLNRRVMSGFLGASARIVGFGVTETTTGEGIKRQGTSTVGAANTTTLNYLVYPNPSLFDSGDSGGPTFLTTDGIEVQSGVHSAVNATSGSDVDVEANLPGFLQPYFINHDQTGIDYDCSNIVPNEGRCQGSVLHWCDINTGLPDTIDCSASTPDPQGCGLSPSLSFRGLPVYGCSCQSCNDLHAHCGTVTDDCGYQIYCGKCRHPYSCGGGGVPNVCGCTPVNNCELNHYQCGSDSDGCGNRVSCGDCPLGFACHGHQCIRLPCRRPPFCP